MLKRLLTFGLLIAVLAALTACGPLVPIPTPTPQIIIVTPEPSATPPPTNTPPPTDTPSPSPTPTNTLTPTPFPCTQESGQWIVFDEFRSAIARENLRYRVYVPPCYQETLKRYPLLILLHGLRYTELQWDEVGIDEALDQAIRLGALGPMIVALPHFGSIGVENSFPPDPSYVSVIMDELLPTIRSRCVLVQVPPPAAERCMGWLAEQGVADPAAFEGTDEQKAKVFWDTAVILKRRIELMLALPLASLDRMAIQREIRDIGSR